MKQPTIYRYYSQLANLRRLFIDAPQPMNMTIIGRTALGKTKAFTLECGELGTDYGLIDKVASPIGIFTRAWEYRHLPIVIDDVDGILKKEEMKTLLKMMLEKDRTKLLSWNKSTRIKNDEGEPVPNRFTTRSNFCIVINELPSPRDAHVEAVLSRGLLVRFMPSVGEVHRYAGGWFEDDEIYDFISMNLSRIDEPDLRMYEDARLMKLNGEDWRGWLRQQWDSQLIVRVGEDDQVFKAERKLFQFVPLGSENAKSIDAILEAAGIAQRLQALSAEIRRETYSVAEAAMSRMVAKEIIKVNERGYFR